MDRPSQEIAAASGAKRTNASDEGTAEEEASRKRQRMDGDIRLGRAGGQIGQIAAQFPTDGNANEAKSNSLRFDTAAATEAAGISRQSPVLRLQAMNAAPSYAGGTSAFLLREREQMEQSNLLINNSQHLQFPTNDQVPSFLRMPFSAINHPRFSAHATNPSSMQASHLLDNLARSELTMANLLARQNGLPGLPSSSASGLNGSLSAVHPLLQSTQQQQAQETRQQQFGRLMYGGSLGFGPGPSNFHASGMAAGGYGGPQMYRSMINHQSTNNVAVRSASLPQDDGANRTTRPFARNSSLGRNTNTSVSAGTGTTDTGPSTASASDSRPLQLPPIDEGLALHYSQRTFVPLGIDEDNNWLSELHCLVRLQLVEVFRAGRQEVAARSANKRINYLQVGVRCRFCAHLPSNLRAARSSAFPSSIRQIYQSFTMMLRDHFGHCSAIPDHHKKNFLEFKTSASQGASHSKHYWNYSAKRVGLADTDSGIVVTERTQAEGKVEPPFGSKADQVTASTQISLVLAEDRALVNDFMYTLMSQALMVHLLPSEQIGNRKSLPNEMPGFGCRYCSRVGWLGLSRMFPARRRTLRSKVLDLYTHLKRCSLCPQEVKKLLESLEARRAEGDTEGEKLFFDHIWARLTNS